MAKPKPDYGAVANHGLRRQAHLERLATLERQRDEDWPRVQAALERAEEARMITLAQGIHTEQLLQQIFAQVPEDRRSQVEARIRPFTKIQVSVDG